MANTENVVTFRCGDELLEEIDTAVDRSRFNARAEFLRWHLEETIGESNRITSDSNTALAERVDELETALSDVECRLKSIESDSETSTPTESGSDTLTSSDTDSNRIESLAQPGDASDQLLTYEETETVTDALAGWQPGKGGEDTEKRRAVGVTALEWLREQGDKQQRSDFLNALYETHALEGQGEESFWVRLVRPALTHAGENGYVEIGARSYTWTGE